jgi:putative transposase
VSLRDKLVTSQSRKANPEYERIASAVVKSRKDVKRIEKAIETSINQGIGSEQLITLQQQLNVAREELKARNIPYLELEKSKNDTINEWELNTPKAIRAEAVIDVCKAMKTGYANLKAGNIRHFRLGYRKKTAKYKSISVPKSLLANINGNLQLCPNLLKENSIIRIHNRSKKKHKNFSIDHDARLVKRNNEYWVLLPTDVERKEEKTPVNFCGVDPGVRTFMTAFGNKGTTEYEYRAEMLSRLETTIDKLTDRRTARGSQRISRRRLCKLEKRKENLINDLHWKTINHLVKNNDYIFYGDIKSHGIVKHGQNSTINRDTNNLKFYKFKQRLMFKAKEHRKRVFVVNEAFTTQTCSFCGSINHVGSSKQYHCGMCKNTIGRDINASKNITMKGMILYLVDKSISRVRTSATQNNNHTESAATPLSSGVDAAAFISSGVNL